MAHVKWYLDVEPYCFSLPENNETRAIAQVFDEINFDKFDNLKPIRIEESKGFEEFGGFAGDNARGDLHEFQSLDELGEAARVAGEKFKACFATK